MDDGLRTGTALVLTRLHVLVRGAVLRVRGQVPLEEQPHRIALNSEQWLDRDEDVPKLQARHDHLVFGVHARPPLALRPRSSHLPRHVLSKHVLEIVKLHVRTFDDRPSQPPSWSRQGFRHGRVATSSSLHPDFHSRLHPLESSSNHSVFT